MKLVYAMPVMNQREVTLQSVQSFKQTQTSLDVPLIIVDNGSNPKVESWIEHLDSNDYVHTNAVNVGVLPALNQIYEIAKKHYQADYIFYTHNDVLMFEKGWDEKLMRILSEVDNVGVAGFYGAKGIGTADIYQTPYVMQQLIRIENVSNCNRMDRAHGYRNIRSGEWEEVAVMDGFSLIVSTKLLDQLKGFDTRTGVHHNYDNNVCMDSWNLGYRNIVISMDAQHLGGRTDVGEDWATPFGKTKQQVHIEAHYPFYEKWHPAHVTSGINKISLPFRVG